MDFTFLKGGDVAFFRSDAQTAEWTEEELNLHCVFPYIPDKEIERGMVVLFQDPATADWQAYMIRQCQVFANYQQIEAEDIAVTELSACHIPETIELDNVTAKAALTKILTGTGWSVGTVYGSPVSSGDITRGSVWQNVSLICQNWNVYIMPRVTVNSSGISGRYLDIVSSGGADRGLRLAVNKNVTDPCVVYDDSDLCTALYGYGGTYSEGEGEDRVTLEYNFSSVAWSKTSDHPAKPKGQKFLEYPEMTALYGLNGKPRYGYYQNTNISDPAVLLQKTWETLKTVCQPKISISGTVTDLKRLGYADVPLRLHDLAIVELEPLGVLFYKQVVKLTVNLLDPTKNLPTIGDYIPNIIYINRETESFATGGGKGSGGGGGGSGRSRVELEESEFRTGIYDTGKQVGMYARKVDKQGNILSQAGMDIDPETGVIVYAENNKNMIGSKFKVQSDQISLEVRNRQNADSSLSAKITVNSEKIETKVSKGNISSTINQTAQGVLIRASKINLEGYVTVSDLKATNAEIENIISGKTQVRQLNAKLINGNIINCGTCTLTYITTRGIDYNGTSVHWRTLTVGEQTIRYLGA